MSENWPKDARGHRVNPWYSGGSGGTGGNGMKKGHASLQFPWWFFGASFGIAEAVRRLVA